MDFNWSNSDVGWIKYIFGYRGKFRISIWGVVDFVFGGVLKGSWRFRAYSFDYYLVVIKILADGNNSVEFG